jgi:ATP phosphoribosyltransferase regulatory subunit
MTPTVEYYDVLAKGLTEDDRRASVRFIEAGTGAVVALRSDLTPQIARMVAARTGPTLPEDSVLRFCYAADVVRQPRDDREETEYHQAGVELIGDSHSCADAELLALCDEVLTGVGLPTFAYDLSHRALARPLVQKLVLSGPERHALLRRLGRKDRGGVEELLRGIRVDPRLRDAVVGLTEAYGSPDVVNQARPQFSQWGLEPGLDQLQEVLGALRELSPVASTRVSVDLGEVRGFDYYTGLRFRVWAPGVAHPVVRGGRYDDLLARYGTPAAATGFAVDLDALEAALAHAQTGGTQHASEGVHLVVVARDASASAQVRASVVAGQARSQGSRAWVQRVTGEATQTVAQHLADRLQARWVSLVQHADTRRWCRSPTQWCEQEASAASAQTGTPSETRGGR